MMKRLSSKSSLFATLFTLVMGCGVLVGNPDEKTGDDGQGSKARVTPPEEAFEPASLSGLFVHLMDAPVDDAQAVNIKVASVEVLHETEGWIQLSTSSDEVIDLLALQAGKTLALVDGAQPPVGSYQELRLILDADYEPTLTLANGARVPLRMPSAEQSGIKIKTEFTVAADSATEIVLDFDLRKSIKKTGPTYMLTPVLRSVEKSGSGFVVGSAEKDSIVCLYAAGAEPDGDSECGQALSSSVARGSGDFALAFVPVGTYTLRIFEGGEIRDVTNVVVTSRGTTRIE